MGELQVGTRLSPGGAHVLLSREPACSLASSPCWATKQGSADPQGLWRVPLRVAIEAPLLFCAGLVTVPQPLPQVS